MPGTLLLWLVGTHFRWTYMKQTIETTYDQICSVRVASYIFWVTIFVLNYASLSPSCHLSSHPGLFPLISEDVYSFPKSWCFAKLADLGTVYCPRTCIYRWAWYPVLWQSHGSRPDYLKLKGTLERPQIFISLWVHHLLSFIDVNFFFMARNYKEFWSSNEESALYFIIFLKYLYMVCAC